MPAFRSSPRVDQEPESDDKQNEHPDIQSVGRFRSAFELFPDQDTPHGGDQRGSLPQSVGNRSPGLFRSDHAERLTDAPDHTAQDTDQVRLRTAPEIAADRDRLALDRTFHRNRIEDKVAGEHSHGKDEYGRIGRQLPGSRSGVPVR